MKIRYLAHSSFLIITEDGKRIITDPYDTIRGMNYRPVNETADIVTISHGHFDHNNAGAVKGSPQVIKEAGTRTIKGITIKGIPTYHDSSQGSQRGNNIVFCLTVEGVNLCHLGDLGHLLSEEQMKQIGPVDVLFLPVGGNYTINASQAADTARLINPKVIIPMHYKTPSTDSQIAGIDEFLKEKKNIRKLDAGEIELKKDRLPAASEIIVLQHTL